MKHHMFTEHSYSVKVMTFDEFKKYFFDCYEVDIECMEDALNSKGAESYPLPKGTTIIYGGSDNTGDVDISKSMIDSLDELDGTYDEPFNPEIEIIVDDDDTVCISNEDLLCDGDDVFIYSESSDMIISLSGEPHIALDDEQPYSPKLVTKYDYVLTHV